MSAERSAERSADGLPILTKTLHDQRRSLVLWALGLAILVALYVPVFTRYQDTSALTAQTEAMPEGMQEAFGLDQIATAAGYVQSTIYGTLGLLLLLVFAVGFGTRAVAGEEEAGTLDLYLAHPLSRRRLVVERVIALTLATCGLAAILGATIWAFAAGLSLDVPTSGIVAASLGLGLLAAGFGTLAVAIGGARRPPGCCAGRHRRARAADLSRLRHRPTSGRTPGTGAGRHRSTGTCPATRSPMAPTGRSWHCSPHFPLVLTGVATAAFDRRDVST